MGAPCVCLGRQCERDSERSVLDGQGIGHGLRHLPKVIAAEEKCSPQEAIERTVQIHNELMHTFVAEAAVLSHLGSPALRRFLADIWAWLGGSREWHSTSACYHGE